jgi:prephenate dehydrogenase
MLTPAGMHPPCASGAGGAGLDRAGRPRAPDDPDAHDASYAAVSHLPHLLAFAAINALQAQPEAATFLSLAGPGFRDFTRIAASDPSVWRDILLANQAQVLAAIPTLSHRLEPWKTPCAATTRRRCTS